MEYPVYKPEITEKEKEYVLKCLESTWISSKGEYIEKFEQYIADYVGVDHATCVMNGTAALHLALLCLDIGPKDEVIVPDLTYIASANVVKYVGAKPILVDVNKETWNIDLENIKRSYTSKTKAIIVTDIYGTPVDMDPIMEFAAENNLFIIEDSAEALGAKYKDRMAGNLGHVGIFSFFGNKTITTGEGGMLVTNDEKIYEKAKKIKNQGNSETIRYYHDILGYNFRMTNIQAAIGCAQFERLEDILEKKRWVYDFYKRYLDEKYIKYQKILDHAKSSYWMVSLLVKDVLIRDELMAYLAQEGIETRPFFVPISKMPYFEDKHNSNSILLSECGLNIPSYHSLQKEDILFISEKINGFLEVID